MEEISPSTIDLIAHNITDQDQEFARMEIGIPLLTKWQVKKIASILTDVVSDALTKNCKNRQVRWPISTQEGYQIRVKRILVSVFEYPEEDQEWDNDLLWYSNTICNWYHVMMHPPPLYIKGGKNIVPVYPKNITYEELYSTIKKKFGT